MRMCTVIHVTNIRPALAFTTFSTHLASGNISMVTYIHTYISIPNKYKLSHKHIRTPMYTVKTKENAKVNPYIQTGHYRLKKSRVY